MPSLAIAGLRVEFAATTGGWLTSCECAIADDRLHFAAPGYDGAVDAKQGRARLQLSSAYSIESMEVLGWEKPKNDNC